MPEMLQRFSEEKRGKTTDNLAVETVRGAKGAPWKSLEDDGKITTRARIVGIFLPERDRVNMFFESRLNKNSRQEYKASDSWNRQPESTWSKLHAAMTLTARTE